MAADSQQILLRWACEAHGPGACIMQPHDLVDENLPPRCRSDAPPRMAHRHLTGTGTWSSLTRLEGWLPAFGVLDAAARDRAFRYFAGAVEVARAFYLSARANTTGPSPSLATTGARQSPRT
ncbi:hypothetical protein E4U91_29030 [Streptomyces lasalocidi]|uniref:Uncharacterized protein n=1 Tax=Streptomyces lasalocidi TaxID=324833 RepID=A0A4U5WSD0_STRLS|nr:hypothetical protein E4U91_29030 [Streptomyces lasalocidi]